MKRFRGCGERSKIPFHSKYAITLSKGASFHAFNRQECFLQLKISHFLNYKLKPDDHANNDNFKKTLAWISLILLFTTLIIQSCEKNPESVEPSPAETLQNKKGKGNPHNPPPPPPAQFYFTNCGSPDMNGSFKAGVPSNVSMTLHYVNSPGGSYPAFTSSTVNGISVSTPPATLNTGSGSIVFTATGTPAAAGFFNINVSIAGSINCILFITVTNAPVSGPTVDPGPAPGSTGIVNFIYKGQPVAYKTVRAKDGKIWLQQNLGAPQVAFYEGDVASFGDYFQWGRWDDGHQTPNSFAVTGSTSLMNPSNIPSGFAYFIKGTAAGTKWWETGSAADTWNGSTVTATNGKDPCTALGSGWHMPTAAEWQAIALAEDAAGGTLAAFMSNLKLPSSGYRYSGDASVSLPNAEAGYYWTSTAAANGKANALFFDNVYNGGVVPSGRAEGYNCRCVK